MGHEVRADPFEVGGALRSTPNDVDVVTGSTTPLDPINADPSYGFRDDRASRFMASVLEPGHPPTRRATSENFSGPTESEPKKG